MHLDQRQASLRHFGMHPLASWLQFSGTYAHHQPPPPCERKQPRVSAFEQPRHSSVFCLLSSRVDYQASSASRQPHSPFRLANPCFCTAVASTVCPAVRRGSAYIAIQPRSRNSRERSQQENNTVTPIQVCIYRCIHRCIYRHNTNTIQIRVYCAT
ncbi:hypothetical protein GQ42DRAFT_49710 [Ramicandelaber brevisporus]|nr:hypothetical protein GQ42DRAFT_49710 [Ramicandelaber brevisporus]